MQIQAMKTQVSFEATTIELYGSFISLKGTLLDRCCTSCLYGLLGGHMSGGNESTWQICKTTLPCTRHIDT